MESLTMKKLVVSLIALGMAAPVLAQDAAPDFATIDADADGSVTLEELNVTYPDVTAEAFGGFDADASGGLSAEEFAAWVATLPA
jgi:hypothetical protein